MILTGLKTLKKILSVGSFGQQKSAECTDIGVLYIFEFVRTALNPKHTVNNSNFIRVASRA